MTKEIKYLTRLWNKDIFKFGKIEVTKPIYTDFPVHRSDLFYVDQFLGLHDTDGDAIFENDVLKAIFYPEEGTIEETFTSTIYAKHSPEFYNEYYASIGNGAVIQVEGNLYQHPKHIFNSGQLHLLTGKLLANLNTSFRRTDEKGD